MRGSSDQSNEWLEEKLRTLRSGTPPVVQLFLRSLAPPVGIREQQERVLRQLRNLEHQGVVESVDVTVWGDAVCPEGNCAETPLGQEILARISELRQWAIETPVDIDTPFEEKHVSSSVTNESFRRIIPPRITVGVYTGDDVSLVLPCHLEGRSFDVVDFLSAFEQVGTIDNSIGTSA